MPTPLSRLTLIGSHSAATAGRLAETHVSHHRHIPERGGCARLPHFATTQVAALRFFMWMEARTDLACSGHAPAHAELCESA